MKDIANRATVTSTSIVEAPTGPIESTTLVKTSTAGDSATNTPAQVEDVSPVTAKVLASDEKASDKVGAPADLTAVESTTAAEIPTVASVAEAAISHGQSTSPEPSASTAPQHSSASLYIGDLHGDITENSLYEIFQAVGPVQSIRVCRDVVTRRSLGYAYINFHNVLDAERALDTMNYYVSPLTKNRPLRIMWKIRDPSARKNGAGNIFIKSLHKSIDNRTLYDTFSQLGSILSCKVACDDQGQSLGYGFVHFESPESAEEAISKVNGMLLADRKVYVGKFLSRKEREAAGQAHKYFTNVFVKNLHDSLCTEEKLRDLFASFGDITSLHVPQDAGGKPKGFAFANFSSPEMAQRCTVEMDGKELEGQVIYVGRAQKRSERAIQLRHKFERLRLERIRKYQDVNLYVKNLSDEIDDERLREEFAPFGTITSSKIMRDEKNHSRGFGFVCFSQPDEATKAVTGMNGRMFGLKPIYVALAQRKEVRRAQLAAQREASMHMLAAGPTQGVIYAPSSPYPYQQPGLTQAPSDTGGAFHGGYMSPHYSALGRGAPVGQQASISGPPGQPRMHPGMPSGMMQPHVISAQRQSTPYRQRPIGPDPNRQMHLARRGPNGRARTAPNGPQFKYTDNARNAGLIAPSGQKHIQANAITAKVSIQPPQQVAASSSAMVPLSIDMLMSSSPKQQKQMLGERLYPQIAAEQPTLAGKITGMLLEMESADVLHLLESKDALKDHVSEALAVLKAHAAAVAAEAAESLSRAA